MNKNCWVYRTAFALLVLVGCLALAATTAEAAEYDVNTPLDVNDGSCDDVVNCSLREAIIAANTSIGVLDVINIPAFAILLTAAGTNEDAAADGDLDITDDVALFGAGVGQTVVDGGGIERVFHIDPAGAGITVEMSDLTITGGVGGIRNNGGLILTHCNVSGNNSGGSEGGGILVEDTAVHLNLVNSTVSDNLTSGPDGGGISAYVPVTIVDSTISRNTGSGGGGIWYGFAGELRITNSTISGNEATGYGGGIAHDGGTFTLENVTIIGNTAPDPSDGEALSTSAPLTITNTLIEGSCAAYGGVTSTGGNLETPGTTCGLGAGPGDQVSVADPKIGPLAENGGPTHTHLPALDSPAVDNGLGASCPGTDQRGMGRPIDGNGDTNAECDVGAVEVQIVIFEDGFESGDPSAWEIAVP